MNEYIFYTFGDTVSLTSLQLSNIFLTEDLFSIFLFSRIEIRSDLIIINPCADVKVTYFEKSLSQNTTFHRGFDK